MGLRGQSFTFDRRGIASRTARTLKERVEGLPRVYYAARCEELKQLPAQLGASALSQQTAG